MSFDADKIVGFIRAGSAHPMKPKELAKALDIKQADYGGFRQLIKKLIADGELVMLKRGRIGVAEQLNVKVGQIAITRGGTGFLPDESGGQDIMIPQTDLFTALDGDKVMVRLIGIRSEREAGTVIKVIERAPRNIVGVFRFGKTFSYVVPDNPRIHRNLYVSQPDSLKARDGEKVVVVLTAWEHPSMNPEGKITERLGFPGDPGVDMQSVIKGFNLSDEFPPVVMEEAEKAAAADLKAEAASRVNLTEECVYTIDPVDAKDFDDAVSVVKTKTGYSLGVHIADVSFFVSEGSDLDKEAFGRGNSVYLPGTVIPMLPEVLSNDVCSLRPNRRRLAHSVQIEYDRTGKMLSFKSFDSVIKSRARLAYEEVQAFFDDNLSGQGKVATRARIERVSENLTHARELAWVLTQRRKAAGSLDLDLPETKITLDKNGDVTDIREYERLEAHRLVEEFMLAANKAVALEVFRKAKPFLYRVHEKPDMEKLEAFSEMMARLGHRFPVSPTMKPVQFARFLEKTKEVPEAPFINELMLRSLQKAVYQRENIGHFGLAFKHYTHFTSPIRRYPDLMVHRLLRRLRGGTFDATFTKKVGFSIDNVGRHCSETERLAQAAEREAVKIKQVAYMASRIGEEFSGVISGVMPFGFFVRLEGIGVEGLVRMSSMDDDYYLHEEKQYRIVGRRNNRTFRLGDQVRVGVMKVDTVANEVDLSVIGGQKEDHDSLPFGRRHRKKTGKKQSKKVRQTKRKGKTKASGKKNSRKSRSKARGKSGRK